MHRHRLLFLTGIFLVFSLVCCRKESAGEKFITTEENPHAVSDITLQALSYADSLMALMPLEEQAAQMLMPALYASSDASTLRLISHYVKDLKVGGILLLKGNAYSASVIADTIFALGCGNKVFPGMFLALDAETGLGMRFSDAPLFPWNSEIGDTADDQAFYEYGREIGRECRITGINMILGPVVDVDRKSGGRGIMHFRSLGTDPQRVSELGMAYGKGIESQGVISVAKHFPGHGATSVDTHKMLAGLQTGIAELDSMDLSPFRILSENGISGIMVGHLWAQALDSVKRPASFSPVIIKDLLKEKIGFEGLVLVDAVVMGGANGYTGVDAIAAGADIIIAPTDTPGELADIMEAVESGRLSKEEITDRCRRILFYKYLFDIPFNKRKESGITNEEVPEFLYLEAADVIESLQ